MLEEEEEDEKMRREHVPAQNPNAVVCTSERRDNGKFGPYQHNTGGGDVSIDEDNMVLRCFGAPNSNSSLVNGPDKPEIKAKALERHPLRRRDVGDVG